MSYTEPVQTDAPAEEEHVLLIPEDVAAYFDFDSPDQLKWPFAFWFYNVQIMLKVVLTETGFDLHEGLGGVWGEPMHYTLPLAVEDLEQLLFTWKHRRETEPEL